MNRTSKLTSFFRHTRWLLVLAISIGFFAQASCAESFAILDEGIAEIASINCALEKSGDGLIVSTSEEPKDALVDISLSSEAVEEMQQGFNELHFRMKTSVNAELGEYIVYWIVDDATEWKEFHRIPFRPDGAWHDYRLPLNATGKLKALRLTFGKQTHQIELGKLQLVQSSLELPGDLAEKAGDVPEVVQLSHKRLSVMLNTAEHRYQITDSTTGRTWNSQPVSSWLKLYGVEYTGDHSLRLSLFDLFSQDTFWADVEVKAGGVVKFFINAKNPDVAPYSASRYPPRFTTEMSDGHLVFCDRSNGVLLDQKDTTYAHWPLRVYGNTHCLDMPWVGLFDEKRADGSMLLVESPSDAEVAFVADDQGLHWPEVRWLPSMDKFSYGRSASLRFTSQGGYNELAATYRQFLKAQDRFKTLQQKAELKPETHRLKGAPALWAGRYPTKFIRQMRPLGMDRGIVGNCKDPGIVTWLNDLGYLTGRYDNYVDITDGENRFTSGNVEQDAVRPRPGSAPKHGWKLRSGRQMYWRSSARWPAAVNSYVVDEMSRIPFNSRFIDVTAAGALVEDYHPEHTFDRRQDMKNRRALYERMAEFGLVLGTEHGNDWIIDLVEYFEGSMSGPFWWSSWEAGHLIRPRRDQLTDNYLKYGMGFAHRIPLWELVYHDCAVTTWYWGDTAGLLYEAAPELADRKDLFNILYGTTPLFWMNNTGYKLPDELHRMLRTYHDTCQLHQLVAFEQMNSHEFLSGDRAVQRTTFGNGVTVVVNFSDQHQAYHVDGKEISLAPNGYHVASPEFVQQRLWVNDAPQTVIAKQGFLLVESDGKEDIRGVKCNGRLTALRSGDDRWNVFVDPGSKFSLNIPQVTGWNSDDQLRICHMDDTGDIHATAARADAEGMIEFQSSEEAWRFVLVREEPHQPVATAVGEKSNL